MKLLENHDNYLNFLTNKINMSGNTLYQPLSLRAPLPTRVPCFLTLSACSCLFTISMVGLWVVSHQSPQFIGNYVFQNVSAVPQGPLVKFHIRFVQPGVQVSSQSDICRS